MSMFHKIHTGSVKRARDIPPTMSMQQMQQIPYEFPIDLDKLSSTDILLRILTDIPNVDFI